MNRFGVFSLENITQSIDKNTSENTKKSKTYVWKQFSIFCKERQYQFDRTTSDADLAKILKDWAYNMRKLNGEDYKEMTIKTIWNTTAKMLMDKFFNEYGRKINPFDAIEYKEARGARDSKRKELQAVPSKRKVSSTSLCYNEFKKLVDFCNENTPEGLQKKVFYVFSYELAWRGGEAVNCLVSYFDEEVDNLRNKTGRIRYNPIFGKTAQGGAKKCAESKWLIVNRINVDLCPIRLYKKFIEKRGNVKSNRFFMTANPHWKFSGKWYKDIPIGRNELSKWTKNTAKEVGLDVSAKKITNHSLRSSAVSALAKGGVGEEQLIKITGHSSTSSIKPYIQLDDQHHEKIIKKMRGEGDSTTPEETTHQVKPSTSSASAYNQEIAQFESATLNNQENTLIQASTSTSASHIITYNNCIFHCNNLNC